MLQDKLNAVICKMQYIIAREFLNDLFKSGIPYAIVKGCPLEFYKTGISEKRMISDIDILVYKENINKVVKLLKNNCFTFPDNIKREDYVLMLSATHQYPAFYKSIENFYAQIDLNFDIFWGEYEGKRVNIEQFLQDTVEIEIFGIKVRTLPPLKAMIQLILHHYKDMNSIFLLATQKSIKYEMFKDVFYLLKNNLDTISLEKMYEVSATYKIIPYVFYVLYYTGQVFQDKTLQTYIDAFRTLEGEALLNVYGLCEKERKEWKYDFTTRLKVKSLFDLIKNDLTENDFEKIAINKRAFIG